MSLPLKLPHVAALFALVALSSCSGPSGSDPTGPPRYPPHPAVQPSVAASTFNSGPSYDWETQMPEPPRASQYRFANTRSFQETTAWIKKTLDAEVAVANKTDPATRFSDIHFEGCIFEWHEDQGVGTTHINSYDTAANLNRANMGQIMAFSSSFRVGWEEDHNVLFRAWEKEEGRWRDLGERVQTSSSKDFPVSSREMCERLRYAFIHAARLCGAKVPEY